MCGITGSTILSLASQNYINAISSIKYRGPDNIGRYKDENIFLAHVRLSISDLTEDGNQPFTSKSYKNFVLVFNGEIYNIKYIKKYLSDYKIKVSTNCDTELLYLMLANFGIEKTLELIEGIFSFAFYDKKKQIIWLCRDHFGIKPLYYSLENGLSFSSSQDGLNNYICEPNKVNSFFSEKGILSYLQLGYNLPNSQHNNKVKALLPGHYIYHDIKNSITTFKKWFEPSTKDRYSNRDPKISHKSILTNTEKLIEKIIKEQSVSDTEGSIFLSGGIDSTLIAANVDKNYVKKAYTIKYLDKKSNDESYIAEKVARDCGLELSIFEFDFFNYDIDKAADRQLKITKYPFANSTVLSTDFLCQKASKEGIRMTLVGDGGDEIFGGYPRYKAIYLNYLLSKYQMIKAPALLLKSIISISIENNILGFNSLLNKKSFLDRRIRALLSIIGSSSIDSYWKSHIYLDRDSLINKNLNLCKEEFDSFFPLTEKPPFSSMIADLLTWIPFNLNHCSDLASMNNNLEIRVPFLDRRLIQFISSQSISHLGIFKSKILLKNILNKKGFEYITKLPKKGFNPPLKTLVDSNLTNISNLYSETDYILSEYINIDRIKYFLRSHKAKQKDFSRELWSLFLLAKWVRDPAKYINYESGSIYN